MRSLLVSAGLLLIAAGVLWPWLGHLPGDIAIERPNLRVYVPWVTCLLISVVLTLLFWLFRK